MHVKGDRVLNVAAGRVLADLVPGARYVEIPGDDHFPWLMNNWREMADGFIGFCTGSTPVPTVTRRFATVLFTDIVGSTQRSGALGDSGWRAVLEQHDRITRELIEAHGGRTVKSTGDGLLAVFDVPSQGVECGIAMCRELAAADGELWASSTVRDMMLGGGATFDERGEHALKGIDGSWKLFAVC